MDNNPRRGYLIKEKLKGDLNTWIEKERATKDIYPLTLEFAPGPWMACQDKERDDAKEARERHMEREIGLYIERLYIKGVVKSQQTKENGWAYCGWPDKGGKSGLVHHHGFLIMGVGKYKKEEWGGDFKNWFEGIKEGSYIQGGVQYAYVSAKVETVESVQVFNGYAAKKATTCVWYKAGQKGPTITWESRGAGRGLTGWYGGGFEIISSGKKSGFIVDGGEHVFSSLRAAQDYCESVREKGLC